MYRTGFTLMELLISVALFSVLAGVTLPMTLGAYRARLVHSTAAAIRDGLREAQSAALAGKHGSAWGMHFGMAEVVVFAGDNYVARQPEYDRVIVLPVSVSVNASGDIVFLKEKGVSLSPMSVSVEYGAISRTVTVRGAVIETL